MILTPTVENFPRAIAGLDDFLDEVGSTHKARIALNMALEEVFMNVAHHSGATALELDFIREGEDVILRFADNGTPYNPLLREEPDISLPAEVREIGGLGVLMIRRLTDSQTYGYEGGRNILTLRKRVA